jgi:hypothetical protein
VSGGWAAMGTRWRERLVGAGLWRCCFGFYHRSREGGGRGNDDQIMTWGKFYDQNSLISSNPSENSIDALRYSKAPRHQPSYSLSWTFQSSNGESHTTFNSASRYSSPLHSLPSVPTPSIQLVSLRTSSGHKRRKQSGCPGDRGFSSYRKSSLDSLLLARRLEELDFVRTT